MHDQPAGQVNRGDLNRLLVKVREERGVDLSLYRRRYVERRVAVRLNALGLTTYRQYAAHLDGDADEYARLLDALTINVTQFFRDPSVYGVFRDRVLPELFAMKASRRQRLVRVWSAGCATGEEPYSIAMSLLDAAQRARAAQMLLAVIGTDIDRVALASAKAGVYPVRQLAQIPATDRNRYVQVDGESFSFVPEVARICRFQQVNLFEDAPIHGVDAVFCRNVFIYVNREDQEAMVERFWDSLTRGGYLVLGRSERLPATLAQRFELVDGRERIYRKPIGL